MNKKSKHDATVSRMMKRPSIIGIDGVVLSCEESHIMYNGSLLSEPDGLAFDPSTHTLYNIEYKCGDYHRERARHQLWKSKNRLKTLFNDWTIVNLYVHGDYEVERF